MQRKANRRNSQSAMEYLMTYGWAILVIAVVLAVLYQLGVFTGSSFVPNACVAQSGFLCQSPVLAGNGILGLKLGVLSPITITGVACTSNATAPTTFAALSPSVSMQSDQTYNFSVSCPLSGTATGTTFSGYIWVQYNTQTQSDLQTNIGSVDTEVIIPYSGPTISYATNGITALAMSSQVFTSNAGGGYPVYICVAAGGGGGLTSPSWTIDAEGMSGPVQEIGHQSSPPCSVSNTYPPQAYFSMASIGLSDHRMSVLTSGLAANTMQTIGYTVSAPGTFVVIATSTDYAISSVSLPSVSCYVAREEFTADTGYYSYIAVCPDQGAGQYSYTVATQSCGSNPCYSWAYAVYGFT